MIESKENRVEIKDFPGPIVRGMLEYIYSNYTEISPDDALEYLRIGDMYHLEGLKEDAIQCILGSLTEINAVKAFRASILYNLPTLKRKVAEFVIR